MKPAVPLLAAATVLGVVVACNTREEAFSAATTAQAVRASSLVDATRLQRHVEAIYAARQDEETRDSPVAKRVQLTRDNAAEYVTEALRSLGYDPRIETSQVSMGPCNNIVAEIPGTEPGIVLLTGHYDAWYRAGADDNATALAVLLEGARVLASTSPRRTIRFVAFDREEEGIIGSAEYAKVHGGEPISAVVNLDCIGYATDEEDSQETPPGLGLRDRGNFLAAIANEPARRDLARIARLSNEVPRPIDTVGLLAPGNARNAGTGAFLQSDHVAFWDRAIPAIFMTDTASFRNPHYHTDGDSPDTLDFDFLARAGALVVGTVAALANEE